jgi:ribosomal-protein-alanine N-acetyltransferase
MDFFESFPVLDINDKFILREFKKDDVKDYFDLYTIPEINRFIPDAMIPKTHEDASLEIESIIQSFKGRQTIYWAIAEKETNKLIGGCGFHDWNRFNFRIEIAYDIHPDYQRRGIMLASIREVLKFAFMQMGVARVQATTVKENDASNNLLLKCGFKYEGLLRKYKFFKNKMTDILIFSYTFDDFKRDTNLGKFNKV